MYKRQRERHSRVLDAASIVIEDKSSMVAGLPQLILGGLVAQVSGVMYSRPLFEACLLCDKAFRTVGFMACALSQAQRASGCGDACFHAVAPKLTDAFDPTMYAKVSDDTRALVELADSLSEADSGGNMSSIQDARMALSMCIIAVERHRGEHYVCRRDVYKRQRSSRSSKSSASIPPRTTSRTFPS